MQIRQQYNADIMNELGIVGEKQTDFEQKMRKIEADTNDAIGHRSDRIHIDICGLAFELPLSLYRPIEIMCKHQSSDYPFLHGKYGKELIRAMISHYLMEDKDLKREDKNAVLNKTKSECGRLGLPEPLKEDECRYVVQWLTYQCNKISNSFFA